MSKILIVDDDATLVVPLKEGLESIGYQVAVAFDGLQGILQAHQHRPDCIILDFYMPGGGGQTVYERLRQTADTARTPIIFSTVVPLEEVKGRIRPSANTYFLKKPVGLNQVIAVLNQVLGETRQALAVAPAPAANASPCVAGNAAPFKTAEGVVPRVAPKPAAKKQEFSVRVTYADTDKMGVIYYANYFKYFEQGRTELMRSLGVRYRDLEVQRRLFIPAVETGCRFLAPARYDDLLTVKTWITELGKASIAFAHEITSQELGGRCVATGFSRHALVNDLWRPARIPQDLRILLAPFVQPQV